MTENKTKQYSDNQYNRTPGHELGSGFSNYDRLMVELNNRQYYPKEVYENFLNENGLDAYEIFKIIGKPELTCGIRRKYTLHITDNAGNAK